MYAKYNICVCVYVLRVRAPVCVCVRVRQMNAHTSDTNYSLLNRRREKREKE